MAPGSRRNGLWMGVNIFALGVLLFLSFHGGIATKGVSRGSHAPSEYIQPLRKCCAVYDEGDQ